MTAPAKPWELSGANQQLDGVPTLSSSSEPLYIPSSMIAGPAAPTAPVRRVRAAPPLPPRPRAVRAATGAYPSSFLGNYGSGYSNFGSYGGYGSSYGGYGGLGSYGGYGGFGGYGGSQFGFPRGNNPESRFIQMAEEGSRPAFQSIESIVQAFCSVSFMMESTFNAMYSSFRAVLGVAENFGQLRSMFGQFLSVFAIFRWFKWLYRKLLYILRLDAANPDFESLFAKAEAAVEGPKKPALSWPVVFFLGIVFTGPYLMWKLLNSLNIPSLDPYNINDWRKSKKAIYAAVALYDFPSSSEQELPLQAGQRIFIAPKELQPRGLHNWLIASVGKKVGLVPANYIQIMGRAAFPNNKLESAVAHQVENPIPELSGLPHQVQTTIPQSSGLPHQVQTTIPQSSGLPHQVQTTIPQSSGLPHQVQTTIPQSSGLPHQVQTTIPQSSGLPYQVQNTIPQPILPNGDVQEEVTDQLIVPEGSANQTDKPA